MKHLLTAAVIVLGASIVAAKPPPKPTLMFGPLSHTTQQGRCPLPQGYKAVLKVTAGGGSKTMTFTPGATGNSSGLGQLTLGKAHLATDVKYDLKLYKNNKQVGSQSYTTRIGDNPKRMESMWWVKDNTSGNKFQLSISGDARAQHVWKSGDKNYIGYIDWAWRK